MISELSFLIELLLNHDLPKATKDLIASRIKEVEQNINFKGAPNSSPLSQITYPGLRHDPARQAPSTLAAMARHGDIPPPALAPTLTPPEPVAVIAQTPATAAAMQARQESISAALSGKVDKISGKPRKW